MVLAFGGVSLALATSTRSASADPPRVDWGRAVEVWQDWLVAAAKAEKAKKGPTGLSSSRSSFGAPYVEPPILDITPHVTVLGRDWNEAFLLTGRLSATDIFRLAKNSRMMLARVGFGDGILVPFAQVAVGQWRVDTDVMPGWVCNPEIAGQVGAGLELRVLNAYSIAVETDYTALYREQREPQDIPYPRFWGAMTSTSLHF